MTCAKEIGGYFELEITKCEDEYHSNAMRFNSCRNALKHLVFLKKIKKLFVPYYTCDAVVDTLLDAGCQLQFYEIDEKFFPKEYDKDSYLLYTNYFGICSQNIRNLLEIFPKERLIIDNAQAFFMPYVGIDCVYSPRKFFGVSDGGYLYTNVEDNEYKKIGIDCSCNRFTHLLKRVEHDANTGYAFFKNNESIIRELPIMRMSNLTRSILQTINYEQVASTRLKNFNWLHEKLRSSNELKINPLNTDDVPMCYPYLSSDEGLKDFLIRNKVYVATYWDNRNISLRPNSLEAYLMQCLIAVPVDQRYSVNDMEYIVRLIDEYKFRKTSN